MTTARTLIPAPGKKYTGCRSLVMPLLFILSLTSGCAACPEEERQFHEMMRTSQAADANVVRSLQAVGKPSS